jgi:hypothetical protein
MLFGESISDFLSLTSIALKAPLFSNLAYELNVYKLLFCGEAGIIKISIIFFTFQKKQWQQVL